MTSRNGGWQWRMAAHGGVAAMPCAYRQRNVGGISVAAAAKPTSK